MPPVFSKTPKSQNSFRSPKSPAESSEPELKIAASIASKKMVVASFDQNPLVQNKDIAIVSSKFLNYDEKE